MIVDVDENTALEYQKQRLEEKAAPKTINEEVGFLLRLPGERGELVRARLRKRKLLKPKVSMTLLGRSPGSAEARHFRCRECPRALCAAARWTRTITNKDTHHALLPQLP